MAQFEKTFSVSVPVERAWQAWTDPEEMTRWFSDEVFDHELKPGGKVAYGTGGYRVDGTFEEVTPGSRLCWTEEPGLLPDTTEVTVTFTSHQGGTRITVTHAGFGEGEDWLGDLESHAHGWSQVLADLVLYLETGVAFRRGSHWRSRIGIYPVETDAGVRVGRLVTGGAAEEAGLQEGDFLVQLNGAPLFDIGDLWLLLTEHQPDEELEAVVVRPGGPSHHKVRLRSPG